ncbi:hypothetical protein HCX48_02115 [Rhodocyclus tenuis]|uniref:Uncharacterized protein n=2 Tax=Rhodocyclus TaxID=1064 RepID=A0A6L5JTQ8_RHOTE|nr:hypothetical protein [Rhodocyclus gracilis]MQY50516.1 hypothetical protein [Rhodocyclus gracilis]MRD72510.1 hypothetical protein [Rhodocyclus gracilis]NJA88020.1 hypothetical protein [Rhodocyclus gracilis]
MQRTQTAKFGFRIRTRSGAVVDNLTFSGRDALEAERKLRQIYLGCEIIESRHLLVSTPRNGQLNYEDVVDLISKR